MSDCKAIFINEYNTELSGKLDRYISIIDDLVARGIPIDGVGHQFHIQIGTPAADVLKAIDAVDNLFAGLENHATELDISVYNDPGSCFANQTGCATDYGSNLPENINKDQAQKYRDIFDGFTRRSSVTSVTTWGVSDADSWLNNYPIKRSNYPLLFDREMNAKISYRAIADSSFVIYFL